MTSCGNLGTRLQFIRLEWLGKLQREAWDSLQEMIRTCSPMSLNEIILDFASKGYSTTNYLDSEGCTMALKAIAEGLVRRTQPIEWLAFHP